MARPVRFAPEVRCPARPAGLDGVGLHLGYHGRTVVHGTDVALRAGRTTALVGPNGSGKSTLLRVLARLHRPDAGALRLHLGPEQVDALALGAREFARHVTLPRADGRRLVDHRRRARGRGRGLAGGRRRGARRARVRPPGARRGRGGDRGPRADHRGDRAVRPVEHRHGADLAVRVDVRRTLPLVAVVAVALALAAPVLRGAHRTLDLMAVDDDTPRVVGVRLDRARALLLGLACLLTAAAVAAVGVIAFVGLVAPHAARALVGARHARVLPLAALLGATLVSVADTLGRTVIAPQQLPAGLLAALVGAPYFVWLLWRSRATG